MIPRLAFCALALSVTLLSACSSDKDSDSTAADPQATQPALTGDQVCPGSLAEASDKHGFGGAVVAADSPTFPDAAALWVCTYGSADIASTGDGGVKYGWQRIGPAKELKGQEYDDLLGGLGDLTPAPTERMCTADLGPRVMIGHVSAEGRVTGVVVDLYGCRDVRLTPDPATVAPGESEQDDVPSGVFSGTDEFIAAVSAQVVVEQ